MWCWHGGVSERSSWRGEALTEIVGRFGIGRRADAAADLLNVLTSFETYDALAQRRGPKQVVTLLQHAVSAVASSFLTDSKRHVR